MAKSLTQIQRESDERRGIKQKTFKLPVEFITRFEETAKKQGIANNALLMAAFAAYCEKHGL